MTINSSLTLSDSATDIWDAVVVGAGPAGTVAAREMARHGARVLLVEKAAFPRPKVCGGCINQRAQLGLEAIGLGSLLDACGGKPLHAFHVGAARRSARIALPPYIGLSRETLDAALVREAIKEGVSFLPRTRATLSTVTTAMRTVGLQSGDEKADIRARIVLAADGLGGKLLRGTDTFDSPTAPGSRIGAGTVLRDAPACYEEGVIHMACADGGYVGVVRVEEGRLCMAAAFDAQYVKESGGLVNAARAILEEAGFSTWPALEESDWRGTPALSRTASRVTAHRAFVLGDAAGYVEPFTGEGIAWAINTAMAVSPIALDALDNFNDKTERAWQRSYRSVVKKRAFVCRALSTALRHPMITKTAVGLVSRVPTLARPMVNRINASPILGDGSTE